MNLIFCGTPEFAVPTLERLLEERFTVQLVVTNPDEASGRGYEPKPTPVKQAALQRGLLVFQPRKLKDPFARAFLSQWHPDAMVVVAYGHLLPSWLIELPRFGCINLHASLLPKYRGAAPIHWAIVRGERVTGVTTMKIDAGLDTGDVLLRREIPIRDDDTAETLAARLSVAGAELMVETLRGLERGTIVPERQDPALATAAPPLRREDGRIDWSLPAPEIERRVRGFQPWPGAYTTWRGKNLHVWKARVAPDRLPNGWPPGTSTVAGRRWLVACGSGTALELLEVQLEGRKRMPVADFLNGLRAAPGEVLGAETKPQAAS
jgi:methionyl-tRNA formyltransferase